MISVLVNDRWPLTLLDHRADVPWSEWEKPRLASMHANLKPDDLIVDCGSEQGDLPCLFASWGCDVVLAEPSVAYWPNIRTTFVKNGLADRVVYCWVGFLGDEPRAGDSNPEWRNDTTSVWPRCSYGPVTAEHGFSVLVERPDLPVTTIDRLPCAPPDAITIDTEGSELRVLRGAEHTLRDQRPLVWVSIHLDHEWVRVKFPGEGEDAVYEFMASVGYKGLHLADDHERHVLFAPTERLADVAL